MRLTPIEAALLDAIPPNGMHNLAATLDRLDVNYETGHRAIYRLHRWGHVSIHRRRRGASPLTILRMDKPHE